MHFDPSWVAMNRYIFIKNYLKRSYVYIYRNDIRSYYFFFLAMTSIYDYRKSLKYVFLENTIFPQDIIDTITKKIIDNKYTLDFCKTENYRVYNLLRLVKMGMIGDDKLQEIKKYQEFITGKLEEFEK